MPIARNNSFHLMLSDDELTLLKMLAEQKGLNASDYLRTLIREGERANPMTQALAISSVLAGLNTGEIRLTAGEAFEKVRQAATKTKKR
jgi:hypothetical protein